MHVKVYKHIPNSFLPSQLNVATINIPTYKLAKFLLPILKSLTSKQYSQEGTYIFSLVYLITSIFSKKF